MAYNTLKACQVCNRSFKARSNRQVYCTVCRPEVRKKKNKVWQHNYNMRTAETKNENSRAYNKSEKGRASQQLRDAVRKGSIKRQPCEVCQEPEAQGHHEDYSKALNVRWLCPQHHREEHLFEPWQNEIRRAGYEGGFELSQLIEACGEEFEELSRDKSGNWDAFGNRAYKAYISGTKATPTEAVATLWLALHAHTDKTI